MSFTNKVTTFAIAFSCVLAGCGSSGDGPMADNAESTSSTMIELKTGGIYASRNEEGKYGLVKILALDESTVHARFYNEEFDELPTDISSDGLTFLIGHAPLAREGFLSEDRELITVEAVSESELDGYRIYLEAMRAN